VGSLNKNEKQKQMLQKKKLIQFGLEPTVDKEFPWNTVTIELLALTRSQVLKLESMETVLDKEGNALFLMREE
jgi:hypothetical protein